MDELLIPAAHPHHTHTYTPKHTWPLGKYDDNLWTEEKRNRCGQPLIILRMSTAVASAVKHTHCDLNGAQRDNHCWDLHL